MLEEDVAVLMAAAHRGMLGVERMIAELLDGVPVDHVGEVGIIPLFDLLDLVAGAEAVKEVDERHLALDGGQMRHGGQVHDLLRVGLGQHGKAGLTAGVDVGMVAEDVQRVGGHGTGRDMEYAGQVFGCDLVHVGDHQQKALRSREGGGERTGGQAAVHCASRAGLRLHLHHLDLGAEDVLLAYGGPLVHTVRHGAGRRDGVDGSHFCKRIGYMRSSGVAIHGLFGSWHCSSSSFPAAARLLPDCRAGGGAGGLQNSEAGSGGSTSPRKARFRIYHFIKRIRQCKGEAALFDSFLA